MSGVDGLRSLLILAHGSRREASNDEVRGLATAVAARMDGRYDRVGCAFLELAEPDIAAAIEREIEVGCDEIVCLPYFLSAGRHVAEDIPAIIEAARERHPGVRVSLERYLGAQNRLAALIADVVP
ncbi:Sirohydrochlorin cobaltochelatase [wastewater metagenome]|uniref:Sirohydrochlorin cobaltochelatase n=2 Tax=unclassified sequences TaxID=12908 RepID=A0A5B8RCR9_9ZZZZ|nr:CbiX/SirB N-terminal domain-containing protein [Arhodomonas sp. KWT]QEA04487.1 sirohydrochlorin cobaltochelatase [uncultured organism]